MKDVLNDFKKCGRPMTKNELKIKQLKEDLEIEKSTSSNLARRILKAIKYMEHYIEVEDAPINERIKIEFEEILKILTGEYNE